jgi:uncharacterized membrane protein YfcA
MEAIKYYVKGAFQGIPETPEVLEQQEELIADLTAKVADLVAEGKPEQEALGVAIASLGDLSPLVAEFTPAPAAPGENAVALPPTKRLYVSRLDLHVVAFSLGLGAVVMALCTVLGAWTSRIDPGSGLTLVVVVGAAAWWIRTAYERFKQDPDARETRELTYGVRLRKAVLLWVGVSFVSMLFNAVSGTDFWVWPLWVAATMWPVAVLVEQRLAAGPLFEAPADEGEEAA